MSSRIENRLSQARQAQFVGRTDETALFRSLIEAAELPVCILFLFGPGGVGKTTLLNAFAAHCEEDGIPVISLDGRHVQPTPEAFLNALRQAMGLAVEEAGEDPMAALAAQGSRRRVLLVDTYEVLEPLDGWLRDVFLPRLSENMLVVLAGRQPPSALWRADSGWQTMVRALPLRNLSPDESRSYLLKRSVPPEQHQSALNFTHGHPLALSLVADVIAQRGNIPFEPEAAPDVIQALVERFLQKAPSAAHQAALEICALVRLTTESLLAHLLLETQDEGPETHDLFQWLRGLSFIESGRRGLFPHDLAREALLAELRWRDPERYAQLHRRTGAYYAARFGETKGQEQQRVLLDFIFLHRDNAVVRFAFEWQESQEIVADTLRESDADALHRMVTQHEGDESARVFAHWLAQQPQGLLVFREAHGAASEPVGFGFLLSLHEADEAALNADPATRAAWEHLKRHAPLRPGEAATHFRFWMARDTYQAVSPIQSLIIVDNVRQCVTLPGLAYTFLACADPDFWEPIFSYAEMKRIAEAEFSVGGRRYGVFGNDWRTLPPLAWLALLAEKEIASSAAEPAAPRARSQPILVLSEADFATAVRDALRFYCDPGALRANPLLRSRVVVGRMDPSAGIEEKIAALRTLVREASESLQSSPRASRAYRALYHTYLHPAPTQEQAADLLDLPFSTYRRHLREGIQRVTEILWRQELGEL